MKLTELDIKLLDRLQSNGRMNKKELGKLLRISPVTVAAHMRRLEKDGVIQSYVAILDPSFFGLTIEAAIEISVQGGHIVEVETELSKNPNVYEVYDVTGDTDVLLLARFSTREELNGFVKSVLANPYVLRTNTRLILSTVKRSLEIPVKLMTSAESPRASP